MLRAGLLAAVDVAYADDSARAACVLFRAFADAEPLTTLTAAVSPVAPYTPGEFYLRELPPILAVLGKTALPLACVLVDGYVWLGDGRPGLGARLFDALGPNAPAVIGVAKTHFEGAPALPLLRGESKAPLWITAVGVEPAEAAAHVAAMHGPHRVPTLLREVDRASRARATTSG